MGTSLLQSGGDFAAPLTIAHDGEDGDEAIQLVSFNNHDDRHAVRQSLPAYDPNNSILGNAITTKQLAPPSHDAYAPRMLVAASTTNNETVGYQRLSLLPRRTSSFQKDQAGRQRTPSFASSTRPEAEATSRVRLSSIAKPIGFGNSQQPRLDRRSSRLSIVIPVRRRTSSFARENDTGLPPGLLAAPVVAAARHDSISIVRSQEFGNDTTYFVDSNPIVNARRSDQEITRKFHRGEYDAVVEICKELASACGRKLPKNFVSLLPHTFAVITRDPREIFASSLPSSSALHNRQSALGSVYVVRTGCVEVIATEGEGDRLGTANADELPAGEHHDVTLIDRYVPGEYFGELPLLFGDELTYCVTFRAATVAADRQVMYRNSVTDAAINSYSFTQCIEIPHAVFSTALQCEPTNLSKTMRPSSGPYGWLRQRCILASVISTEQHQVFTWRLNKQIATSALASMFSNWFAVAAPLPMEALRELTTTYAARQSTVSGSGSLLTLYRHGDVILRHDDAEQFVIVLKGSVWLDIPPIHQNTAATFPVRIRTATPSYPLIIGESTALLTHSQHSGQENDVRQPHYLRKTDTLLHSKDHHSVQIYAYNFAYCIILHRTVLNETALEDSHFHRAFHERKRAWHRLDAARDALAIQRHGLALHQVEVIVHVLVHAMNSHCRALAERNLFLPQAWSTTLPTLLYEFILTECIVPQTVDENTLVITDKKHLETTSILVLDGQLELLKKKNKSVKVYAPYTMYWKNDHDLHGKKLIARKTSLYMEFSSERLDKIVQQASVMAQENLLKKVL